MLVWEVAATAAERFGGRTALEGPDGSRTFEQLVARSARLAAGLLAQGLRPGDRVLEMIPNGCALVESDLALALAGLVRVPLNPRLGPVAWRQIAQDCTPAALLVDREITFDTAGIAPILRTDQLIRSAPTLPRPAPAGPEDLVGLAYSSGTTGAPKGAGRTHRMRLASAQAMITDVLGRTPTGHDTFLHSGPMIHTSGLFVLPFLLGGGRQILLDHATASDSVAAIDTQQITHTVAVPTTIGRLLEEPGDLRFRLRSLQMLAYAGAPMPPDQLRRAHTMLTPNLVQYYGLVEAMPPIAVLTIADHARAVGSSPELLSSAGTPVPSITVRIDDTGEITLAGDAVMPGYWNAGRRTDLGKAVHDGILNTGDIGRIDQGHLFLTDRKNDMIITGGYNVYPREIEDVVTAIGNVRAACVVGIPDPVWGQRLAVAFRALPGMPIEPAAVIAACRQRLPRFKCPKQAFAFDDLPLGATGKIDRRAVLTLMVDRISGG